MELLTTHCHTGFTNHGYGEIEEYIVEAKKAGLTQVVFTEHYPLTPEFDPHEYLAMKLEDVPKYLADIRAAQERNPEMTIMTGCELDWLGSYEDRPLNNEMFDEFDLVLMSVHFVDAWPFDDPAERGAWDEPGAPDRIWRRYFENWIEAVQSPQRAEVMSHPDLAKKFNFYPSYDPTPLYKDAAEACAASGRLIEMNTSGTYYACKEMFPAPALLAEFCAAGVPCTIGTDAHQPEHVARDLMQGYKAMYEAGYREVMVPMPGGERRVVPLDIL